MIRIENDHRNKLAAEVKITILDEIENYKSELLHRAERITHHVERITNEWFQKNFRNYELGWKEGEEGLYRDCRLYPSETETGA